MRRLRNGGCFCQDGKLLWFVLGTYSTDGAGELFLPCMLITLILIYLLLCPLVLLLGFWWRLEWTKKQRQRGG